MPNKPHFTIGLPRLNNVLSPETRNIISSPHKTPGPDVYQVPDDNINFKRNTMNLKTITPKFFEIKNMSAIKEKTPIQYTGLDGVSPKAD
jgi:hypothetical protein